MARQIITEVVVTCDFCGKKPPGGVLHWDSKPVSVDGVDYLVDACDCVTNTVGWTPEQVFADIAKTSRAAEEAKRKPRGKDKQRRSPDKNPRKGPFLCRECGIEKATYRAKRIHESKEHGLTSKSVA